MCQFTFKAKLALDFILKDVFMQSCSHNCNQRTSACKNYTHLSSKVTE